MPGPPVSPPPPRDAGVRPRNSDLSRLAIHTQTNRPWSLRACVDAYAAAGIGGICLWRHLIDPSQGGVTPEEAGRMVRDANLAAPALVRGGFFPASTDAGRQEAIDRNLRILDEAAAVGARMVVLVVGALPEIPLAEARKQVAAGLAACLEPAEQRGVKLAIEPLHPMYAGDKSCINRMTEARRLCEQLQHPAVGIAVDPYHLWWDPDLEREIALAGERGLLMGFHLCDWRVPTRDMLTDRGLMGEGCIDLPAIRRWMENAGFTGYEEVEIFSEDHWARDQHAYLDQIVRAYRGLAGP